MIYNQYHTFNFIQFNPYHLPLTQSKKKKRKTYLNNQNILQRKELKEQLMKYHLHMTV